MKRVKIITNNKIINITVKEGTNLLQALINNGIIIPASCGGKGICNKCRVRLINGSQEKNTYVKSCQYIVEKDISIGIEQLEGKGLLHFKNNSYKVKTSKGYGMSIDIGTTTIAYYLIDLSTGAMIDNHSELNKQSVYGADVISRIKAAEEGKLSHLKDIIVGQINQCIKNLVKKYEISSINKIIISANTVMLHLLANVNPASLGKAPYDPVFIDTKKLNKSSGIECDNIILLPSSSAYIGSDITAGILSSTLIENDKINMLIDIGTNGEVVLYYNNKLYATATAAGPAFEGAKIEKGMGGVEGAIDHIWFTGSDIGFSTVSGKAKGICGSGLVELIALLIQNKLIDETGYMQNLPGSYLNSRLIGDKFYINEDIYITQKDVREYQLAKSAIYSGIMTLLNYVNLSPKDINIVYLAGGFGHYLNKYSGIETGLLPREFKNKIVNVGNSSGLGAIMCLVNEDYIKECEKITNEVNIIDLVGSEYFNKAFIDNMAFDDL